MNCHECVHQGRHPFVTMAILVTLFPFLRKAAWKQAGHLVGDLALIPLVAGLEAVGPHARIEKEGGKEERTHPSARQNLFQHAEIFSL